VTGAVPAAEGFARHIIFRAGGERFAVPLGAVREVVLPQPPFARVPRAAPGVRGAMNLHGRVVAVVELAALLGLPPEGLAPTQGHVLVLDAGRRGLGLLVASVLGVDGLPPPDVVRAPGGLVRGVSELAGAAVAVLDAGALEEAAAALFRSS